MADTAAQLGARLKWSKFSRPYRQRLVEGGLALDAFLRRSGAEWKYLEKQSSGVVDDFLESFVREMHSFRKSSSLRIAKHGVLFMQCVRPRLKRSLKTTWNAIRSWEEQRPSGYRSPLPVVLLAAMLCQARKLAYQTENRTKELWLRFSALLSLGFFGLLRPGELFKLQSFHVTLPNAMSLGAPFAVIMLEQPKNSRQMGKQQFSSVQHPDAVNWLSWLVSVSSGSRKALWPSTPAKFRVLFKEVCGKLGIGKLKLSPASLRAGGATWMMDEGTEISRIRFLGRWSHLRSLEHYLQVARAQQISLTLEPSAVNILKSVLLKFSFMLTLPDQLAALVPKEHLVTTILIDIQNESHVVSSIRRWSQLADAVQKGHSSSWAFERRTLP